MSFVLLHLAEDDLRGEVLGGATERPGPTLHALSEAEVGDLINEGLD